VEYCGPGDVYAPRDKPDGAGDVQLSRLGTHSRQPNTGQFYGHGKARLSRPGAVSDLLPTNGFKASRESRRFYFRHPYARTERDNESYTNVWPAAPLVDLAAKTNPTTTTAVFVRHPSTDTRHPLTELLEFYVTGLFRFAGNASQH